MKINLTSRIGITYSLIRVENTKDYLDALLDGIVDADTEVNVENFKSVVSIPTTRWGNIECSLNDLCENPFNVKLGNSSIGEISRCKTDDSFKKLYNDKEIYDIWLSEYNKIEDFIKEGRNATYIMKKLGGPLYTNAESFKSLERYIKARKAKLTADLPKKPRDKKKSKKKNEDKNYLSPKTFNKINVYRESIIRMFNEGANRKSIRNTLNIPTSLASFAKYCFNLKEELLAEVEKPKSTIDEFAQPVTPAPAHYNYKYMNFDVNGLQKTLEERMAVEKVDKVETDNIFTGFTHILDERNTVEVDAEVKDSIPFPEETCFASKDDDIEMPTVDWEGIKKIAEGAIARDNLLKRIRLLDKSSNKSISPELLEDLQKLDDEFNSYVDGLEYKRLYEKEVALHNLTKAKLEGILLALETQRPSHPSLHSFGLSHS